MFGIGDAGQVGEEFLNRINRDEMHAHVALEGLYNLCRFAQAQQPVVHEHAGELIAHRALDQRGRHRRIYATTQPADDARVADLLPDRALGVCDQVRRSPVGTASANIQYEVVQQGLSLGRVLHLGVKLDTIDPDRGIAHRRY